ncbi:MAG: galactose-1-phosphate uridylyltransferase [Chloroflexota bacterium]|nr:galactose-1-phosphate uridylyltransferase [Dehalococcoidia bacterium]MDW8253423.1 galactose-1-phosphate uridylyltransferase [Chloroflexota bacterium]
MTELRWDPLRGEWIAAAAERQERTFLPPREHCPFCPTTAGGPLTEAPAPYEIAVLQNRFPALQPEPPPPRVEGTDLWPVRPGLGVCEVVLYTPVHDSALSLLPVEHLERLVRVWRDRYRVLGERPEIAYVYIFENRGEAVGVTLHHPHGQIYAMPFVPPIPARELESGRQYRARTGRCLLCDLAAAEQRFGRRLVLANARFVVYCPFGSRFPYEAHVTPLQHLPSLLAFDEEDCRQFAAALGALLRAYDRLWNRPMPYMLVMHQAPTDGGAWPEAHFHTELYPLARSPEKLKYLAGSESGAGLFVTDILPESAAPALRSALDPSFPA